MFVKAHKSQGKNSGSCADLAEYMEKEAEQEGKDDTLFFSHDKDSCELNDVIDRIDHNVKGIGKDDDKFYMITINPSNRELLHLIGADKSEKKCFEDLTSGERQNLNVKLQEYTREVMNIYAKNFERDKVKSGDDLVYFARIETERYYRHYDKEVGEGKARPGDKKPGLNFHVHVIVSRNSKDQSTKLSPHAKSRGNTWELNGKQVKRGFDHEKFKVCSQEHFNQMYSYKPYQNESYKSKNPLDSLQNKAVFTIENKIKGQIKQVLAKDIQDNFMVERQIMQNAVKAALLVKNPVIASLAEVRKQLASIIKVEKMK
ncbi:MAG: DUF5712 family protein [Bacteroidales bacterium]|jgi:hypothetical protein|nr:DUF5712 family protein [Bacteroidales bacterium]